MTTSNKNGTTKKFDFEEVRQEALENCRQDREHAYQLIADLIVWVKGGPDRHADVAMSLSKYVETAQKSNEQIVKILDSESKRKEKPENLQLDGDEQAALFDKINGSK